MAQGMFLTPKRILSYLCVLEGKLPKRTYKIYQESHKHIDYNFSHVTESEMNEECQKMLAFVGLGNYKADAHFATLPGDTAGRTCPGKVADGCVHIEVNINLKDNWEAVLAILAHEICHHVTFLNYVDPRCRQAVSISGFDSFIDGESEVYTELCTIYVGFGQLILNGYNTKKRGVEHTLGYLDPNNYKVTNHIVAVICGGINSQGTSFYGNDVLVDETMYLWESDEKRKEWNKKNMERRSNTLASTLRDIANMESLLDNYRNGLKQQADSLDKEFSSFGIALHPEDNRSIRSFNSLYVAYTESLKSDETAKTDMVLEAALYNLYNNVKQRIGTVELRPELVCPSCGKRYPYNSSDKRRRILKCGKCGSNFLADTTDWNPTQVQRQEEQRRMVKQKKQQEEQDAYRYQIAAEEKAAAWKEAERLKQELTTIQDGITHLPRPFRWMLNLYITKQSNKTTKTYTK